jgi:hypothetical protein
MANNKNTNFLESILVAGEVKGIKLESKPELTLEFKKK